MNLPICGIFLLLWVVSHYQKMSEQCGPVNQNELERFFILVVSLCFPSPPQVLQAREG